MLNVTSKSNEKIPPNNLAHLSSLFKVYNDTTTIAIKNMVLIKVNFPYFVFIRKTGRIENTPLSGVSVIMDA